MPAARGYATWMHLIQTQARLMDNYSRTTKMLNVMCKSVLGSSASRTIEVTDDYDVELVKEVITMIEATPSRAAALRIERLQILQKEIESDKKDLEEILGRLGEHYASLSAEQRAGRLEAKEASQAELTGPLFQILDPNVQMIQGVPKGIADAIILLEARKIQRSRNQTTAAG